MSRVIRWEEFKKNNTTDSLWLLIHGSVYDVTKFIDEHPGGEMPLKFNTGKDASENFVKVGHSDDAVELLKKYKIGLLAAEDAGKVTQGIDPIKLLPLILIPVGVAVGAYFLWRYLKK